MRDSCLPGLPPLPPLPVASAGLRKARLVRLPCTHPHAAAAMRA